MNDMGSFLAMLANPQAQQMQPPQSQDWLQWLLSDRQAPSGGNNAGGQRSGMSGLGSALSSLMGVGGAAGGMGGMIGGL